MGKAIPTQHPAVVLRSHYRHMRSLLAVALVALVALTAAVVILAIDDDADGVTSAAPATQASAPAPTGGIRFDGGPEEGTRGTLSSGVQPGIRFDGGPEEGAAFAISPTEAASRYDGGPDEGTRGPGH
jgi:hypothetical protein